MYQPTPIGKYTYSNNFFVTKPLNHVRKIGRLAKNLLASQVLFKLRFNLFILQMLFLPIHSLEIDSEFGAVAVINADTGRVLYSRAADECFYPASTTKIATALFVLDVFHPQLNQKIRVSKEAVRILPDSEKARGGYRHYPSYIQEGRGTSAGFQAGEEVTVEEALYGAMLASGNDAANVLAENFGGTIDGFIERLNQYVHEIGCTQTNFTNPHGLHHPDHVTTAFDLAKMARRAMQNQTFKTIVGSTEFATKKRTFRSSNQLLKKGPLYTPYATGIKTGHLSRAKNCFVSGYEKDGRSIIAVFLKCPDRKNMFREMKRLFDELAREELISKTYVKSGALNLSYKIPDTDVVVGCYTDKNVSLSYFPSEEPKLQAVVAWEDAKLPIAKGDRIGSLNLVEGLNILSSVPLYSDSTFELPLSQRMKSMFGKEVVIVSVLFILTACWLFLGKKRMR